jgi:hypothetical protein
MRLVEWLCSDGLCSGAADADSLGAADVMVMLQQSVENETGRTNSAAIEK